MKITLTAAGSSPFVWFILALLMSQTSLAQFQGKIFTTAEERIYLDELREDFLGKAQAQGFDITEATPPPLPDTVNDQPETATLVEYTLGGVLTRNDGSHTVWLNNQPISEASLPGNMQLVTDGPLVVLQIQTSAGTFRIKPGQTLNASTGQIQEAYQRSGISAESGAAPLIPEVDEAVIEGAAPDALSQETQPDTATATPPDETISSETP